MSDDSKKQTNVVKFERIAISKRLRFEVFKRDKFTCQYCGKRAPDVILHADHIEPASGGGPTTILNLITSCEGCNLGKGARPLNDSATLDKQRDMLAGLEERRQQIEMMIEWRNELQSFQQDNVKIIEDRIQTRTGFHINEHGRGNLKKWLGKYSISEVIAAVDESFDTFLEHNGNEVVPESWEKAFAKIPLMASIAQQSADRPYLRKLLYIQGILRRRFRIKKLDWIDYLEHIHVSGMDLETMESRAKRSNEVEDFTTPFDNWLKSVGRPF